VVRARFVVVAANGAAIDAHELASTLSSRPQSHSDPIEPPPAPLVDTTTPDVKAIAVRRVRLAPAPPVERGGRTCNDPDESSLIGWVSRHSHSDTALFDGIRATRRHHVVKERT
jgi:hypothetical protein